MTTPAPVQPVTVSVVMATYNKGAFLREAIDSILAQTFTDWELLVVDDGSTDETKRILAACTDPRIRVLTLMTNIGRSKARNMAIARARGRYIAICDSDDLSRPTRLERQVAFLDAHPDIAVVSGYIRAFSEARETVMMFPLTPAAIRRRLDRGRMGAAHGAAMIRRACFERFGGYIGDLSYGEDFELFRRFAREFAFQSLPEVLLDYRHDFGTGSVRQWIAEGLAHRYALYRSRRPGIGQRVLTIDEFSRRWQTCISVFTVDLLRSVIVATRARTSSAYVLR